MSIEDTNTLIGEVATAALVELNKIQKQRVQPGDPREIVKQVFEGMRNPKPAEDNFSGIPSRLPVILPDWPKLKARYGGGAQEWIVVNNPAEEAPYHGGGWLTKWPPNALLQVQGRAGTLESAIEDLKTEGFKERLKEDWERRKEAASKK